ncbi:unnamed protein product [Auanema sp. JU1783]|nr:unnamed protein product [Auanema sp. JU1783]
MRVNAARVWEDADYMKVKNTCDNNVGWTEVYNKKNVKVWTQTIPNSTFQMVKAFAQFDDVPCHVAFDVLQDSVYRGKWDKYMAAQKDIGIINPNNDIGYYAVNSIPPIRPRDFVMQRSWLDMGDEQLICSHSVCHEDFPPNKAYIRGTVLLSGYFIRRAGDGCQITYISHSDPKGKLPTWLVNRVTKVITPKMVKKLHKACLGYTEWKEQHQPHWKPWRFPEQQIDMARIDLVKCQPKEYNQEVIDESTISSAKEVKEVDDDDGL